MKEYLKRLCMGILADSDILFKIIKGIRPYWKKYKIRSLYDYSLELNAIVALLDDNTERRYKKPPEDRDVYESWPYEQEITRNASRQYISHLRDVMVIGDTDGILAGGYYLTDKIEYDVKGFVDHKPYCMGGNSRKCIIKFKTNVIMELPKAISLIKMWSYNYFHFVFESMSRLGEVEKFEKYRDWPILIDDFVKQDSRNLELINILNKNNREIIWVKNSDYVHVKELIIPPCMTWASWDIPVEVKKGYGYMIDNKASEYLRNTVLQNFIVKRRYSCVYIARGNNKRLVNENEIIQYLERNGFEIFYPDRATFAEEVDCFSTADCVVLCAGGATTNLVFCKKDVKIYLILPFEFRCDSAEGITCTIGINIHLKDAEIVKKGDILMHSTIRFPIEKCDEIISDFKRMSISDNRALP
jgi:hypothetical protein